jgi:hypothetical protein
VRVASEAIYDSFVPEFRFVAVVQSGGREQAERLCMNDTGLAAVRIRSKALQVRRRLWS